MREAHNSKLKIQNSKLPLASVSKWVKVKMGQNEFLVFLFKEGYRIFHFSLFVFHFSLFPSQGASLFLPFYLFTFLPFYL